MQHSVWVNHRISYPRAVLATVSLSIQIILWSCIIVINHVSNWLSALCLWLTDVSVNCPWSKYLGTSQAVLIFHPGEEKFLTVFKSLLSFLIAFFQSVWPFLPQTDWYQSTSMISRGHSRLTRYKFSSLRASQNNLKKKKNRIIILNSNNNFKIVF